MSTVRCRFLAVGAYEYIPSSLSFNLLPFVLLSVWNFHSCRSAWESNPRLPNSTLGRISNCTTPLVGEQGDAFLVGRRQMG